MAIAEKGKIITEEKEAIKKFKDQFEKIRKTLDFKINSSILSDLWDDSILNSIEKFLQYAIVFLKSSKRESPLICTTLTGLGF